MESTARDVWREAISWDVRPRPSQAAGCYSWIPTKCTRPWVRDWALCCSMLSPSKRGKIVLQLPHKDDAVGDAILQKASKALPKCRNMLVNIRSCSSCTHTPHQSPDSHLQTTVLYKFLIFFFFSTTKDFCFPRRLKKKKKSTKFLYIFNSNASTQHFHKTA